MNRDLPAWLERTKAQIAQYRAQVDVAQTPKDRAMARVLLARRYHALGQDQEAWSVLNAAWQDASDEPEVQRSYGLALFRRGEVRRGLTMYDRGRWAMPAFDRYRKTYNASFWQGEDLAGKSIILWAEQGIGDHIMQARVIPWIAANAAKVTVNCDHRLHAIMRRSFQGVDFISSQTRARPHASYDLQSSLYSAWRFVEDPLANAACLQADSAQIRSKGYRKRIGLSWYSVARQNGGQRSVPMVDLAPLSQLDAEFHSLQYGSFDYGALVQEFGAKLYRPLRLNMKAHIDRLMTRIASMDLVITIDNATAHMAGALGVPCWVLLPVGGDYRWGRRGADLPLYPSIRLFRNDRPIGWDGVVEQVKTALKELT